MTPPKDPSIPYLSQHSNPQQYAKYKDGCEEILLVFAWLDYAYKQATVRSMTLPTQCAVDIALQAASKVSFGDGLVVEIDEGDGGLEVEG